MVTTQMLKDMPPATIFATGVAEDKPDGLFMVGSGRKLRWVAVRGSGYWDWAIYCHFFEYDEEWIQKHGDKVCFESHIKKLVVCDDEAFGLYRY